MKFKLDESDKLSRKWYNERYTVVIQKAGTTESVDTYIVYVAVSDAKKEDYDIIYPRFEAHGLEKAGPIAEALVREMSKLKNDAPLSQVKKLLQITAELLRRAYRLRKMEGDPTLYLKMGIKPDDEKKPRMFLGPE